MKKNIIILLLVVFLTTGASMIKPTPTVTPAISSYEEICIEITEFKSAITSNAAVSPVIPEILKKYKMRTYYYNSEKREKITKSIASQELTLAQLWSVNVTGNDTLISGSSRSTKIVAMKTALPTLLSKVSVVDTAKEKFIPIPTPTVTATVGKTK